MKELKLMLKRHEGYRSKVYIDTVGKKTIGYGHNLCANPTYEVDGKVVVIGNKITKSEAEDIFEYDLKGCLADVHLLHVRFDDLCYPRQCVLLDMMFNLGLHKLSEFKRFIFYLRALDFENSAKEMLDSRWATQVKGRAKELDEIMRTGEFAT